MAVLEKDRAARPPRLHPGDVMTRAEFERRYAAMPELKKAELIDGVVYMSPPVSADFHGMPHSKLNALIQVFAARHRDLMVSDNSTVRLDERNQPQPDLLLMRRTGRARLDAEGYIAGPPELIAEIAASSVSYDLHQKKRAYLEAGVLEYLVWLTEENRIIWWQLQNDEYVEIPPAADGSLESRVFPGLVIDAESLLAGDFAKALAKVM